MITNSADAISDGSSRFHAPAVRKAVRKFKVGRVVKRSVDIVGALTLFTVFSPLILFAAGCIAASGIPVIFGHTRIGRDGRLFKVYKFRTMIPDAESALRDLLARHPELRAEWERDHKLKNDPRITRIGRFLRKTSLDELPQLWNVLKGEMSLIGPRPIVTAELPKYGRYARHYISVKPGLTGMWQVAGRNDAHYRRRIALDVYYTRNQNFFLDVSILLKTVAVVLRRKGAY